MAAMTSYLQKKILDDLIGIAAFTPPSNLYLLLLTANPTKSGSFSAEVSAGGYARVLLTGSLSTTDLSTGRSLNTAVLNVGPATADWSTVTYVAVADSSTIGAGNMLLFAALDEAETIGIGGEFQLTPSQLAIALS
jgi:hypothetical protein